MSEKLELLDYTNCISNLPNSILKHFGLPMVGKPLALLDSYLGKKYKNIVVLLLDGMGTNIINHNLEEDGFFRKHFVDSYNSVFPPTTVAATTAIMSGLEPAESGWLGWDQYFPWVDKNVTVFLNTESGTDKSASDENLAWKYLGYESIVRQLNKAGKKAYNVTPFEEPYPQDFDAICAGIESHCQEDGEKYIYAYWNEPDHTMHQFGPYSNEAKNVVSSLEQKVEKLTEKLTDTLLIVTADHGHIDSRNALITDYPKIMDCLVRLPSIEPRALNLFVKEDKREEFELEFGKEFGKDFLLFSKQEVYEKKLFGTGKHHADLDIMIGDYVAIAVSNLTIFNNEWEAKQVKGIHAGYTKDEMLIPFIVARK